MVEKIQVMRKVADWLAQYGWTIYFNSKNSDNYEIFHANSNSKPDLLCFKNNNAFAVETKSGEGHIDLLNGYQQTLKYAGEYYTGRVAYHISEPNPPLPINAFVFATMFSRQGYLYSHESEIENLPYTNEFLTLNLNMAEKPITHTFIRLMWREWDSGYTSKYFNDIRSGMVAQNVNLPEKKPKVGVLLAKMFRNTNQISDVPFLYLNSNNFTPIGGFVQLGGIHGSSQTTLQS